MKKVLLGLTTLLLISCVNLNEPKVQKVENNTKNTTKNTTTKSNVANTQKDDKKPSTKENTELKAKENLKLILKKFQKLLILVRKFLIYYQIQIFLSINKAT